eukprot:CAMPEP_0117437912 /NCGR_PEP_ID=MMETSP0759-20121206/1776_1 /TAXON_ID=63605 /ORGANISM="Percolomonas cosmopolitus, Strain WS" /LENGTH=579 /DNA_ID=CAMNT_0005229575 /DNA_START=204 /DNA_END=1943 /DNA_ORIENTATION=+
MTPFSPDTENEEQAHEAHSDETPQKQGDEEKQQAPVEAAPKADDVESGVDAESLQEQKTIESANEEEISDEQNGAATNESTENQDDAAAEVNENASTQEDQQEDTNNNTSPENEDSQQLSPSPTSSSENQTKRKKSTQKSPPMGPKYSYRAARSPLKNMYASAPLKPPFDLSGNVNISIPEYDPLYDDNLQLHYQHSVHTRRVLKQQRLIDKKGMITEMGDDKKRVHKERAKMATLHQKKLLKNVQKEKMKKEKLKLQMQLQKEKEKEQKRKRVLKMKREHEKRLEAMQAKMTGVPKEAQFQMMLRELDRQGIKYKLTDQGVVLTSIPTGSKSPSKKRASKSPSKKRAGGRKKGGKKTRDDSGAVGAEQDVETQNEEEDTNPAAEEEQNSEETRTEDVDPASQDQIEGSEETRTEGVDPASKEQIQSEEATTIICRLQNKANNLFMEIAFDGTPEDVPKDGSIRFTIQPESDSWKQQFVMENGFITNAATGMRVVHGGQESEPFAVLMNASDDDKKQAWVQQGTCLMSSFDQGVGLTIASNDAGAQVDVRSFDANDAPTDCNWELVAVSASLKEPSTSE